MLDPDTVFDLPWQRQRLHVPRADATLFAKPPLQEAARLARQNRDALGLAQTNIQGRTLEQLRRWSRETAEQQARRYTAELLGESIPEQPFDLVFMAGHQPSLFHPGVWVKNFAIGELAARTNGVGLNLVIDNDTFSTTRIRVPAGDRRHPRIDTVPFDADRPAQPWEEAEILDRQVFADFGNQVARAMSSWNVVPLAVELWSEAVPQMADSPMLARCLTAMRARQERRWGIANLELPISRLCTLDPFLWFTGHLLAHLPRFRDVHNNVLLEYRRVNKVRSRTHPVPDLSATDGWLEAPYWVWREGDRVRNRLFARQTGREVWLSDGTDVFAKLPLTPETDACCAVEVLRELPKQRIRLRTRALTTTLFARLCLADLFVHGIGGSKYDELTDHIIARFFNLSPPEFMTLSATLHVPLAEPFNVQPDDDARLKRMLRDLEYNSDRHLNANAHPEADALVAEKQRLIDEQHTATTSGLSRRQRRACQRSNHDRFHRFQAINRQLAGLTVEQRQQIEQQRSSVQRQLDANEILQDREFSFCLYPAEKLKPFMTGLWDR